MRIQHTRKWDNQHNNPDKYTDVNSWIRWTDYTFCGLILLWFNIISKAILKGLFFSGNHLTDSNQNWTVQQNDTKN